MSVENQTDDSGTAIENNPESEGNEDKWRVSAGGMTLARSSYSTYELGYESLTVTFDGIRYDEEEGAYKIREGHNTHGYFNPETEDVPREIAVAFTVLAHEL